MQSKSYEQVEELLAARFPKPDVRDLIRRLPAPAPHIGSKQIQTEPIEIEAAARLTETMTKSAPGQITQTANRGALKPLSADRFSVNFRADRDFRELLEDVRALLSHAEPKGDLLNVMKRRLEALRSQLLKKRFGAGRKPCGVHLRASKPRAGSAGSKHVRDLGTQRAVIRPHSWASSSACGVLLEEPWRFRRKARPDGASLVTDRSSWGGRLLASRKKSLRTVASSPPTHRLRLKSPKLGCVFPLLKA